MSLWERMFATNLFGPVALTKALLPSMRAAGRGRIVVVSSAGGVRGMPATAAYSAVKGALERWAESLAGEVAPFGIGVTILVTGTFDTDIITDAGTTDNRDLRRPVRRPSQHHGQARPARDEVLAPSRRTASPPGLPRRSTTKAPFVRRPVGPDARMLLIMNRLLPGAGLHHRDPPDDGNPAIRRPDGVRRPQPWEHHDAEHP